MNSLFQVLVARAAGRPAVGVPTVEPRPMARFEPSEASPSLDVWEEMVEVTGETPPPSAHLPAESIETGSRQRTDQAVGRLQPEDRLREAHEAAPSQPRPPTTPLAHSPWDEPVVATGRDRPPSQPDASPQDRPLQGTNSEPFGDRQPLVASHLRAEDRHPTAPSVATPIQTPSSPSEPAREHSPGRPAAAVRREIGSPPDAAPDLSPRPATTPLATRVQEREHGRATRGGEVGAATAQAPLSPALTVPSSSVAQPVTVSIGRIEVSVAPPAPGPPPPATAPERSRGFSGYERVRRGQR